MDIARVISQRSTCGRGKVGCVIAQNGRIIATGYNGPAHGWHCDEKYCSLDHPCNHAIHAEANAIAFAARFGIALEGTQMFCIASPCVGCAKLIIQAGIRIVYYEEEYRDPAGKSILSMAGVKVKKL